MTSPQEQVIYDNGTVKVTQYRLVVENETYAIQNITSIRHEVQHPPLPKKGLNHIPFSDLWFVGGVLVLLFLIAISASESDSTLPVLLFLLLFSVAVCIVGVVGSISPDNMPDWLKRIDEYRINRLPKLEPATHTVVLTSSALETKALSSTDEAYIQEIMDALNQAIILNG